MDLCFRCPCGRALAVEPAWLGAKVRCPACTAVLTVPNSARPVPPPGAAAGGVLALPAYAPAPPPAWTHAAHADFAPPGDALDSETSSLAVWGMLLGLTSFICVSAPVALVISILALVRIHSSKGRLTGTGFAIAGIATSLLFGGCAGTYGRWFFRHLF
ncbi:MAG: DUF4190 domain-containing protein [Planctomycetes bacterium]|nr:DUF4190 domain-containing protein [Planctomycetota bacterium]